MPKPQPTIILTIIIMAIVLALGSILALFYIRGRPSTPEGQTTKTVEGIEVRIEMDPAQAVQVLPPGVAIVPTAEQFPQAQPTTAEQIQPTVDPFILTAQAQPILQPTADPGQQLQPLPTDTLPPVPTLPPPTFAPAVNSVIFINYVVQPSDTLYGITRSYATSIALMSLHGISQEDLVPGTTISLPIGNPDYCPGRRPYAVGEGDTVFSIARRYGTTAADLKAINGLDDNYTIQVAQIICVP